MGCGVYENGMERLLGVGFFLFSKVLFLRRGIHNSCLVECWGFKKMGASSSAFFNLNIVF